GPASPYPSGITASGLNGTVSNVTASLYNLGHWFYGDIDILMVGPQGQNVLLMSDACDTCPSQHMTVTFQDGMPALPQSICPISGNTYRPTNFEYIGPPYGLPSDYFPRPAPQPTTPYGDRLSVFNGTDPNGTWNLYVVD